MSLFHLLNNHRMNLMSGLIFMSQFDFFINLIIFVKPKETQYGQSSPPFGCLVSKGVSEGKNSF